MNANPKIDTIIKYGKILKVNTFDTLKGIYTFSAIEYRSSIYLRKTKNSKTVEVTKLN